VYAEEACAEEVCADEVCAGEVGLTSERPMTKREIMKPAASVTRAMPKTAVELRLSNMM
jgi:hypothetical protein